MNVWIIPAYLILLFFVGVNVMLQVFKLTGAVTAALMRRALRLKIPENERKWLERLFTPVWVAVGVWAFLRLRNESLLVALFGLFSFRSGGNTARTVIYSLHDRNLVRKLGEGGLLSRATASVMMFEAFFVLGMAMTYKAISIVAESSTGLFYLWFGGFLFGLTFFSLVARNNDGVLMKNVMSVVVFFSGRRGKETVERLRVRRIGIGKGDIERARRKWEKLRSRRLGRL